MRFLRVMTFILLAASVRAEETLDLTLQKAVQLALAKNFQIKVEEFNPKIAKAQQKSTSGKFDPTVEASYTYSRNEQELRTLNTNLDTPTVVPGDPTPDLFANSDGSEVDTSIAGLTPWGMTYDIGPSVVIDGDDRRNPGYTRYNTFFGFNLAQPLLKGFGTDVNLADVRIARANVSISQWALRQQVIDIVTQTISVYAELYFSMENLKVEQRSRALAQQLAGDNQKRVDGGVMIPLDVLQAKSDVAAREERVLVAERQVYDNQNFLKQLITDEISGVLETRIDIAAPSLPARETIDRKRDYARAFELRPDYRQALLDIQKRNITVVFRRNQALPRLDLVGSFGVNGIDTDLSNSLSRVAGSGNRNTTWDVGAIFSVPIPNRTGVGNLEVSKLETLRALVDLKRLEQAILVEADNAAGQIDTTRKRIEAAQTARELAEETLKAAQGRLDAGISTTFEVLQFQRDLAVAEASEFRARADYIQAVAQYARLTGSTLDRNRIILE